MTKAASDEARTFCNEARELVSKRLKTLVLHHPCKRVVAMFAVSVELKFHPDFFVLISRNCLVDGHHRHAFCALAACELVVLNSDAVLLKPRHKLLQVLYNVVVVPFWNSIKNYFNMSCVFSGFFVTHRHTYDR